MKRIARIAAYGVAALVLLAGAGVVVLLTFDWNRLKGVVSEHASDASGRKVTIGNLSAKLWSWTPEVVARDITLDNAAWGSRPEMARIKELYVRIRLTPLLRGRLEIENMRVVEPDILLESKGDDANWRLSDQNPAKKTLPHEREDFPVLHHLVAEGGRIGYRAPQLREPVNLRIDRLDVKTASYDDPVSLELDGTYKRERLSLRGRFAPFSTLRDDSKPYPIRLSARIGSTRASIDGGIDQPLDFQGIGARIEIEGKTLAQLHDLLGLPMPKTDPYALSGTLENKGEVWRLRGMKARLGDSNLHGDIAFRADETPPRIVADLKSDKILIDDLAAFWGGDTRKRTPEKKAAAAQRLLSDEPLALPKLRRMNADIRFGGKAIDRGTLQIRDIGANLKLNGGVLALDPLELVLAKGRIRASLRLDGRRDVPRMKTGIEIKGLDLNALLSLLGLKNESVGQLRGRVDLETRGRSLHQLGASAEGGGILVMEGGRIRNILLEAIALDLQEALGQWMSGDKSTVRINCLAAPLLVRKGRIVADPWIFDTTDALVEIRGFIDIGTETVDVTLKPYPKDFSLFNTLTSINIKGNLARRTASVDRLEAVGKLVLKALAAPLMTVLSSEIEENAKQRQPCGRLAAEFGRQPKAEPPADNRKSRPGRNSER